LTVAISDITEPWSEPVVFEAWGTIQHGASLICAQASSPRALKPHLAEPGDIALFSIRGKTWNEVMAAYHEIQGWEPYKPMERR
jgi:hypothetical protein